MKKREKIIKEQNLEKKVSNYIIQLNLEKKVSNYIIQAYLYFSEDKDQKNQKILKFKKDLCKIVEEMVNASGLNLARKVKYHQFKPYGVTAIAILQQSHFAIHTWPEYNLLFLEIFSCAGKKYAEKAYSVLLNKLKPEKVIKIEIYNKN